VHACTLTSKLERLLFLYRAWAQVLVKCEPWSLSVYPPLSLPTTCCSATWRCSFVFAVVWPPRSRTRLRQTFAHLQAALSHTKFARVFRMSQSTFLALLRILQRDLTRDMRMELRSSGGRVDPAVRLALTIRMLAGASYLDMILVFRIASSTAYDVFHSTVTSITRCIAIPGLSVARSDLHRLALVFTCSRQPPNPLYGCVGAVDGICIEIQKPPDEFGPRALYCRKGMYAIPARALVGAKYRFLFLFSEMCRQHTRWNCMGVIESWNAAAPRTAARRVLDCW
jgi:hypothetical protein